MRDRVGQLFREEGISLFGVLDAENVPTVKPHLLARAALAPKAYLLFAVPYFRGVGENLSAYATSRDYHLYLGSLGKRLCAALAELLHRHADGGLADREPRRDVHRTGVALFLDEPKDHLQIVLGRLVYPHTPIVCGSAAPTRVCGGPLTPFK